jgi:hypothetical protein
MPKFRLKPGEIEAVQFDGNNWTELAIFCGTRKDGDGYEIPIFNKMGTFLQLFWAGAENAGAKAELFIESAQKHEYVQIGDWIVKGFDLDGGGGFHKMKDETFKKLYDKIEE